MALAIKYIKILQSRIIQNRKGLTLNGKEKRSDASVFVDDLEQAAYVSIKNVQQNFKRNQFKNKVNTRKRNLQLKHISSLHRLDPFVDQNGIIRVGGKIKRAEVTFPEKHPIVLPKNSHRADYTTLSRRC